MLKTDALLKRVDNLVLIFWGEHFEEATAAIFATKLRQVGLCVKLVGLGSQRPVGKNGLALYPDLSLRDALSLARKVVCIILPCSAATLKHVEADPRVSELFQTVRANGAQFVVSNEASIQKTSLKNLVTLDNADDTEVLIYGTASNLLQYAEALAGRLAVPYAA